MTTLLQSVSTEQSAPSDRGGASFEAVFETMAPLSRHTRKTSARASSGIPRSARAGAFVTYSVVLAPAPSSWLRPVHGSRVPGFAGKRAGMWAPYSNNWATRSRALWSQRLLRSPSGRAPGNKDFAYSKEENGWRCRLKVRCPSAAPKDWRNAWNQADPVVGLRPTSKTVPLRGTSRIGVPRLATLANSRIGWRCRPAGVTSRNGNNCTLRPLGR